MAVARVLRVLKRYSLRTSHISIAREGSLEVATLRGKLKESRRLKSLAPALARNPAVLEALVLREDTLVVAHYHASPPLAHT